ncbi:MAG: hypothetical protein J6Q16_01155, partial [Clostridia bacterium]|nr:hypothetical protein [Clostridia bacterium]
PDHHFSFLLYCIVKLKPQTVCTRRRLVWVLGQAFGRFWAEYRFGSRFFQIADVFFIEICRRIGYYNIVKRHFFG